MKVNENTRDYGFDNMKVFLILLMLFGHCLEEFSTSGLFGIIRAVVYSFHMPLFIFISGYFSKKDIKVDKLLENTLIPFFVFNTLWIFMTNGYDFHINIFKPVYIFWYLLSLFFWRIGIKYFEKIKGIFWISILIGLYCGCISEADRFLSVSRTISFLPYFILGYQFTPEKVKKHRDIGKYIILASLLFVILITIVMNVDGFMPVKMYEFIQSYKSTGVSDTRGVLLRGIIYFVAFVYIGIFINLIPNTKNILSIIGARTLPIYILSPFMMKPMIRFVKRMQFVSDRELLQIICSLGITSLIFIILGNGYINKLYKTAFAKITTLIVKNT